MKSTVSTTEIFKYVLLFTFLFSGFIVLTITYNKAFKLKNEGLSIAEKYEGFTQKGLTIFNNYLRNNGYAATGNCDTGEYGVSDLNNPDIEPAQSNKRYFYCLSYRCKNGNCTINDNQNYIYYNLKIFYKFNLPIIGELITFKITGESKAIKLYREDQKLS